MRDAAGNFKLSGNFFRKGYQSNQSVRPKTVLNLLQYASANHPCALLMNNFVEQTEDF